MSCCLAYLYGLVGATVQVVLRGYQGSNPVIQASELLFQLQLCTHNVPHLQMHVHIIDIVSKLQITSSKSVCDINAHILKGKVRGVTKL